MFIESGQQNKDETQKSEKRPASKTRRQSAKGSRTSDQINGDISNREERRPPSGRKISTTHVSQNGTEENSQSETSSLRTTPDSSKSRPDFATVARTSNKLQRHYSRSGRQKSQACVLQ